MLYAESRSYWMPFNFGHYEDSRDVQSTLRSLTPLGGIDIDASGSIMAQSQIMYSVKKN